MVQDLVAAKRRAVPPSRPSPVTPPPVAARAQIITVGIGLILINLAVYAAITSQGFVTLDDPGYVSENPHVLAGLTWSGVRWAWTTGMLANWHPLTWLSHMLDVQIFGAQAGWHHAVSLGLHAVNTLLVFALFLRMTGAVWRSACVAALFAAHPLHVESVAWISERKDVLSALFWLLASLTYVSYTRRRSAGRYALTLGLFALGLLAKPMVVTLPIVLLLLDYWPLGRVDVTRLGASVRSLYLEKVPFVALAALSGVITFLVQRQGGAVSGLAALPLMVRVTNALVSYVRYLVKMCWPVDLAVFYPYDRAMSVWLGVGALALLVAMSVLVIRASSRAPYLIVGWLWYLVTLLPVIGIVQVGTQAMADRYTYLPLLGPFVMIVWGLHALAARRVQLRTVFSAAAVVSILLCAVAARAQVAVWKDNETLWTHTLAVTRDNYRAEYAIGTILGQQGRPAEARAHFTEAVRLEPGFAEAQFNLGVAELTLGNPAEAEAHLVRALQVHPDDANTRYNLAVALVRQGKIDDAVVQYREALRLQPAFAIAENGLGFALQSRGRLDDALAHYNAAIRLDPALAEAYNNRGFVLAAQGKVADAIADFRAAITLKPDFEAAHMSLGIALGGTGRTEEGIRELQEVLRLNPSNAGAMRALEYLRRGKERQ